MFFKCAEMRFLCIWLCLQEEKQKAAAAERERRLREEAATSKAAQGSKHLIKQLQNKRFKQVRREQTQLANTAAVGSWH